MSRALLSLLLCWGLLSPAQGGPAASILDPDEAVDAIWRVRAVTLHFKSPTTHYYCDILQQRVADIMRAVGAADPMSVRARCAVGSLISETSIRIVAGVPIEATADNVREETTFDARAQLVARSREWDLPTPSTINRFRAVRTELSFARLPQLHLASSDCDLLQAISEQVFPVFDVKPQGQLYCTPGSLPVGRPGLTVRALLPLRRLASGP